MLNLNLPKGSGMVERPRRRFQGGISTLYSGKRSYRESAFPLANVGHAESSFASHPDGSAIRATRF